ncbi:MAG TPA: prolyl oligopeptidase family serine peptidase [Propionibacteriaceae bacterium]|nr:prolyl oligopeptidase family serine peptidase [Propionibacteriaceae bacterium]
MRIAPYGSWVSAISVDHLIGSSVGLSGVQIDGGNVYWLESRADERGRASLWRRLISGGDPLEVTPPTACVRDRVHEYGGGEYQVSGGTVVYSEFGDGRLYAVRDDTAPRPITPEGALRFGDIRVHPEWDLVLAVREDHSGRGEPINTIVALDLDGPNIDGGTVLCSGADFYSTPELSANGRLAWTQWNHPNMPWDSTTIMIGSLSGRVITNSQAIAGGTGESALQPRWLGEKLIFASDRTNWWNLYLWNDGQVKPLHQTEAEFCAPQWTLGQRPYAIIDDDHLLCTVNRSGEQSIEVLQISSGTLRSAASPGVATTSLDVGGRCAAAVLSFPDRPAELALLDLDRDAWDTVRSSFEISIPVDAISLARRVSWTSEGREVHGYFYPPVNTDWRAPAGTLPPMITLIHGGPTGFASPEFKIGYQFWTSRGFGILDVNYSGSAGFGREYRDRLKGCWGVVDVQDCISGTLAMGIKRLADPARQAIRGGSAGGFTALAALTMSDVFNAAISQYGIADLEALAKDTHKFESRYIDSLIGPYPKDRHLYLERSPINHLDQLSAPMLLLQGVDDMVVPPQQAEMLAAAARRRGLPVALIMFEGEGHGFRRAETIKAAIEAQIYFLGRIFGFEPADQVPPISIDNLSS